ncbi:MAG: hypothetical protein QF829_02060 [Candidatus Hydrothermarchaeota archaeon]|nr:hypothetical protein [Candidatus Hydrothermarchaeota archaeon]
MARVNRLTPRMLKRMVLQEKARLRETLEQGQGDVTMVDAEDVDADEQADALEKDIDYIKVLKIEERKLRRKLRRVNEDKKKLRRRVLKKL